MKIILESVMFCFIIERKNIYNANFVDEFFNIILIQIITTCGKVRRELFYVLATFWIYHQFYVGI